MRDWYEHHGLLLVFRSVLVVLAHHHANPGVGAEGVSLATNCVSCREDLNCRRKPSSACTPHHPPSPSPTPSSSLPHPHHHSQPHLQRSSIAPLDHHFLPLITISSPSMRNEVVMFVASELATALHNLLDINTSALDVFLYRSV